MGARASSSGPNAATPRCRRRPRPDVHGVPIQAAHLHRHLGDLVPAAFPRLHRARRDHLRRVTLDIRETGDDAEPRVCGRGGRRNHRLRYRRRGRRDLALFGPERGTRARGGSTLSRERSHDRRIVSSGPLRSRTIVLCRAPRLIGDSRDEVARLSSRCNHRRSHARARGRRSRHRLGRDRRDSGDVLSCRFVAGRSCHRRGREDGTHRGARPFMAALERKSLADPWHPDSSLHPQPGPLDPDRRNLRRARRSGTDPAARPVRRQYGCPDPRQPRFNDHLGPGRVDRIHDPLLRPAGPERGVRLAARRGGFAAVLRRALVLGLVLWLAVPSSAAADTLTLDAYRARLAQVRTLVDRSRAAGTLDRERMLAQSVALLRQTTAVQNRGETVSVDDGPVADLLAGANGANATLAILDAYIATADRATQSGIDPSTADARLREIVGAPESPGTSLSGVAALLDWIGSRIAAFVSGIRGIPDLRFIPLVVAAIGIGLALFIVATLGRGVRERVRREVLLPDRTLARTDDPAAHRRAAEAALAGGRAREAIHELYLYVLRTLAVRELIRYDPALTDRELLMRAAAIPNADALRDLVALYERAWFGLREPDAAEAERAQSLASRVAG